MKSTGETTNTTEKEQKLPVTEKNGTAPEKTEHILNRPDHRRGCLCCCYCSSDRCETVPSGPPDGHYRAVCAKYGARLRSAFGRKRFQAETLSADLCVGETSVPLNDISFSSQVKAGLFDLDHKKYCSRRICMIRSTQPASRRS